jgi:RNA-directed DNA polymerase
VKFPRATHLVITISGHRSKRGWAARALERLKEELEPLGVSLNHEKTRIANTLRGEAFEFLGFDFRRVPKKKGNGYFILMTPKKKAPKAVKAKIRDIIRNSGATPATEIMSKINKVLTGWVNYYRVGNSSRAFSEVRDYVEMKVRTLLTRRKRRQKRSIGWGRWSNEYLYGVLGLYWDWKIHPLKGVKAYK